MRLHDGVFRQAALVINPDRRHLEQTLIRVVFPFVTAFILWRLGYQTLRVLLLAWLTLCPKTGPFPQMSQTFAMIKPQKYVSIKLTHFTENCKRGLPETSSAYAENHGPGPWRNASL